MLAMLLMVQAESIDAARLVAETRVLTRATIECRSRSEGADIIVCARRDADRWRVPFVTPDPGAVDRDDVPGERSKLIARPNNCAEMKLMAYECGMVGASMTAGGRGTRLEAPRPLAP
ncbi:hypothetical protein COC42_12700 [Sphingomonas spermidinifaciens]|uniref:Uncharacterized protein n=1 Tax=Sphingomonas spermidinifaciens TaxID=1141889 RepID=A0A2A4B2L0_9SPHN|nr:hypothetical protein [Sphingomonas spermidinifaciens]PCD02297.1 hypothetical protein COC42_12700 [Sphingomonas spermidinifaciens]